MRKPTATVVNVAVTKFIESKALRISKHITPKDTDEDMRIFFRKKFKVNTTAKKIGIKNEIS